VNEGPEFMEGKFKKKIRKIFFQHYSDRNKHSMEEYLKETNFLNFSDKSISSTTKKVINKATTDIEKAVAIHNFVRDN
jgi:hypothetical protein